MKNNTITNFLIPKYSAQPEKTAVIYTISKIPQASVL